MNRTISKLTRTFAATLLCVGTFNSASSQPARERIDLDALAVKGEAVANQDPLAIELRNQQSSAPARRGFDIGMGAAEGHTADGPGKQRIQTMLSPVEQTGYKMAVSFSLERNRYLERAVKGAAIAEADSAIAEVRNAKSDVFYKLGFDIATAIFGDSARGAQGNTTTGPGSLGIRNSLSPAAQSGFNDSLALNLTRRGFPVPRDPSSPTIPAPPISKNRIEVGPKLQPSNTIRVAVRYKKEYGYKSDRGLFDPGPSSYSAFSISANLDSRDRQRDPVLISNQGKMRDSGGFYICDYMVSNVPLNRPITITIGLADPRITPFETWKGGSQTQPPRGYRRVISDGTRNVTLTEREPSASLVFEMVYDLPPLTSRPPL